MVANITKGRTPYGVLTYNEEKVEKEKARILE